MKILKLNSDQFSDNNKGFTIIELLIATTVFSVVLLLATETIIYVSKTYVKGQVEAQTQQTAQNILSTISQDIQYNRRSTVNISISNMKSYYYFCIGSHVYVYTLNHSLSSSFPTGLLVSPDPQCTPPTKIINSGAGGQTKQLLSAHERLGQLNIVQQKNNNTFVISVRVAYGNSPYLTKLPSSTSSNYQYTCNHPGGVVLGNFCAVSSLTTTVIPRIN